jgi:hypothetical protein
MKRCRAFEKRIPEAIYGELESKARGELDRHLASCRKCSALYRALAETVGQMSARPAPDREADFWAGYWDGLERRLARESVRSEAGKAKTEAKAPVSAIRPSRAFPIRRWVYTAAGAAVFLSVGIFLGRTFFRPSPDLGPASRGAGEGPSFVAPAEPSLGVRASRYVRRSKVILLALVNSDPGTEEFFSLGLPLQKKTSQELVLEAAALKKELRSSDRRLERLVSDLEMILLQIANLKPQADSSAVEVIKAGIESRDIFFKIDLSEVRRATGDEEAGRAPGTSGLISPSRDPRTML